MVIVVLAQKRLCLDFLPYLRPGDPPKVDKATGYLRNLLADKRRYDLGDAGRYKVNMKLGSKL